MKAWRDLSNIRGNSSGQCFTRSRQLVNGLSIFQDEDLIICSKKGLTETSIGDRSKVALAQDNGFDGWASLFSGVLSMGTWRMNDAYDILKAINQSKTVNFLVGWLTYFDSLLFCKDFEVFTWILTKILRLFCKKSQYEWMSVRFWKCLFIAFDVFWTNWLMRKKRISKIRSFLSGQVTFYEASVFTICDDFLLIIKHKNQFAFQKHWFRQMRHLPIFYSISCKFQNK